MPRTVPLIVVCALFVQAPALGDHIELSIEAVHALTPIESTPTKAELQRVFSNPIVELRDIALDEGADFGVRLRASRALVLFCPPDACSNSPAHLAILDVLDDAESMGPGGKTILLLRAAIEALGTTRSGADADVDRLVPLLDHASRDIRAAAARALRDSCNTRAIVPLRARYESEQLQQVRLAISTALRDLGQCGS